MIRATRLRDLPVVDLESAVKIGRVHELILDPGRRRVAAVVVRRGRALFGGGGDWTVPASAVVSVGADALTIRSFAHSHERGMELATYPTLASLMSRKVLSRRGKLLGSVADILLEERTGTIAGYALDVRTGGRGIFGLARRGSDYWPDYIRAEADLRVGRHIIVAPDNALVQGEKIEPLQIVDPSEDPTGWRAPSVALPPAPAPVEPIANKRPRRSRPPATAAPRLGSTIPIAVNGNGKHPEIAMPAERA
jgi:sporulation protein YlmC with PRC-barrel domain